MKCICLGGFLKMNASSLSTSTSTTIVDTNADMAIEVTSKGNWQITVEDVLLASLTPAQVKALYGLLGQMLDAVPLRQECSASCNEGLDTMELSANTSN